ncbi:MAG: SPOR domain-containing protein [Magnetococcales bacterium]|nr:SPOR domain-containing protein [Magnetococcales bacterium]
MKISPNREQQILLMLMSGMILFIAIILVFERFLSIPKKSAALTPPAVVQPKETAPPAEPTPAPQEVKLSPNAVALPAMDGKKPGAEEHPGQPPARPDAAKGKPPMPMPHPGAATPPPKPPKPEDEAKPDKPAPTPEGGYSVQLGAFSSGDKAAALVARMSAIRFDGRPMPVAQQSIKSGNQVLYRVRLGPFPSPEKAKMAAAMAQREAGVGGTVLRPGQ